MLPITTVQTRAEVLTVDLLQVKASAVAHLVYRVADPWAITLEVLTAGGTWVSWVFARSLLTDALACDGALAEWVGAGDVQVTVRDSYVLLTLDSPSGHAVMRLPRADVDRVLDEAEQLVPEGTERLNWERELARLVGEGA